MKRFVLLKITGSIQNTEQMSASLASVGECTMQSPLTTTATAGLRIHNNRGVKVSCYSTIVCKINHDHEIQKLTVHNVAE